VMDTADWQFNLTEFNCHLMVVMMGKSIQVYLQLTNESLHRRNVVHFGITTLRVSLQNKFIKNGRVSACRELKRISSPFKEFSSKILF
jgi:hypothetical protein